MAETAKKRRNWFGFRSSKAMADRQIEMTRGIVEDAKPKGRLTKASFFGGDADGGIDRFRRLSSGMTHQEHLDRIFEFERERTVFLLAAIAAIAAIPLTALYGYTAWYFVIGLVLMIMFCFVKAMQADFSAWRLRQHRMAPLVDYLNNRLPANMQIMDD